MKRGSRIAFCLVAFGLPALVAPAPAAAQVIEQESAGPKLDVVQGTLGVRTTLIRSSAFDPFSGTDALPQISLSIAHPLLRSGSFVVAAGFGTDYGVSSSEARGVASSLSLWRLAAFAEGRTYVRSYAYGFARLAPGLLRGDAALVDPSSPNAKKLEDHFDVLSIDPSVGAAVRVSGESSPVGAWVSAEGGYGWAQGHHLLLAPPASPRDQSKIVPVDLGTIEPRGAFFRVAFAITY
jgi:hypothetical protein